MAAGGKGQLGRHLFWGVGHGGNFEGDVRVWHSKSSGFRPRQSSSLLRERLMQASNFCPHPLLHERVSAWAPSLGFPVASGHIREAGGLKKLTSARRVLARYGQIK